ncbi:MAG: hypothetical protein E2O36_00625 [Proteobacteria bacterium]|nr:MAG: hypothetical protein E2O36_00625 [Pseudomonadota bacterium]
MVVALMSLCGVFAPTSSNANPTFNYRGYIDTGVVITDNYHAWSDGGIGKLRYGTDNDGHRSVLPRLSEALLSLTAAYGTHWEGRLDVKFDDRQRHLLDIAETFISYRSGPSQTMRWRARIGSFLPPVSLENRAIGWTSPYTLSSSVLNTWIGEEIRINGGELKLEKTFPFGVAKLFGAGFFANDNAGKLIALRGFATHDRKLTLFDTAPLPDFQVLLIHPRGPFRNISRKFEPLHEIDGRVGYYLGGEFKSAKYGLFRITYYDNNADPEAFNRTAGQYAWDTRFIAAGFRSKLTPELTLIGQGMFGNTAMGPKFGRKNKRMSDTDFATGFVLLNYRFNAAQVSFRGDYFEIMDRDAMRGRYDGDEDGYSLTFGGSINPITRAKFSIELQYIDHHRPVRMYADEPDSIDELMLRANLRFFF